jgi:hypothetical protein
MDGIQIVDEWLKTAKDEGKTNHLRLTLKVLGQTTPNSFVQVLQLLPITIKVLQSTTVGKSINKIKNHPDPEVKERANLLLQSWTKIINNAASEMKAKESTAKVAQVPPTQLSPKLSKLANPTPTAVPKSKERYPCLD